MALIEYTPQRILTTESMTTKGVVTAEHWNDRINQLIAQGNFNSNSITALLTAIAAQTAAAAIGAVDQAGLESTVQAQINTLFDVATGAGNMPAGGAAGQFLSKKSNTDYDSQWSDMGTDKVATSAALKTLLGLEADTFADNAFTKIKETTDTLAVLKGTTAPTTSTVGVVGQFYLDTVSGVSYQCKAINGSIYTWEPIVNEPIGLVKLGSFSSINSTYALCNGSPFDVNAYPELGALPEMGHSIKDNQLNCIASTTYVSDTDYYYWNGHSVINLNGYDILTGYWQGSSGVCPAIAYARHDSADPFTTKILESSTGIYAIDVIWDGTRFVVLATNGGFSNSPILYYSNSSNLSTCSWSGFAPSVSVGYISTPPDPMTLPYLQFANGYYVIACNKVGSQNAYSCYILYSQSLTGSWSSMRLPAAINSLPCAGIYYIQNTWIILYASYNGAAPSISYCTTSAPTTWTAITQLSGFFATSGNYYPFDLKYVNNKWVFIIQMNNSYNVLVYNTTLSASGWSYTSQVGVASSTLYKHFDFDGNNWVVKAEESLLNNRFYISTTATLSPSFAITNIYTADILYLKGTPTNYNVSNINANLKYLASEKRWYIFLSGQSFSYPFTDRILCGAILPFISLNNANAFIKVE